MLFEVISLSAAHGTKLVAAAGGDVAGHTDSLVDLWIRAEAARSLIFDLSEVGRGADYSVRQGDIVETGRALVAEAIALAMRFSDPVDKFVEFSGDALMSINSSPQ
jgi:hypothetical protein